MGVLGCRVYFNRFLEPLGLPFVFECTGDSKLESPGDFLELASSGVRMLSRILGFNMEVYGLEHWEYIGRRFNLYAFNIVSSSSVLGQVRVVESGGLLVNISGVLSSHVSSIVNSGILGELRMGRFISEGYNLNVTYLRGAGGGWPSGQKPIPRYVIYAAEGIPGVSIGDWSLRVRGLTSRDLSLTYSELEDMAVELDYRDFHCVTGWSVKGNRWFGVRLADIAKLAGAKSEARWVIAVSIGGYSTVIPVDEALRDDAMIALRLNSERLSREQGAPARLVIPRLYGWKSAKWLRELVFIEDYIDGYWEALAYHERGLVEADERFKIRNPVIAEKGELPGNPRPIKPLGW